MTADTGSTGAVSTATIIAWLTVFRDLVTANNAYLTELDSAIGDADHGSNMTRGMDAVVAQVGSVAPESIAELFTSAGVTLGKNVGGASGPLYGPFFLPISRHGCGGRAGRFCCTGEHRGAFHIGGDDPGENRRWRERSAVRHLLPALRFSDPGRCNTA